MWTFRDYVVFNITVIACFNCIFLSKYGTVVNIQKSTMKLETENLVWSRLQTTIAVPMSYEWFEFLRVRAIFVTVQMDRTRIIAVSIRLSSLIIFRSSSFGANQMNWMEICIRSKTSLSKWVCNMLGEHCIDFLWVYLSLHTKFDWSVFKLRP